MTMNSKLLAAIEEAIQKTIDDHCEENMWDGLVHPALMAQMAKAACLVFWASMDGQDFAEREK